MRLCCRFSTLVALLSVASNVCAKDTDERITVIKVAGAVYSLDWSPVENVIAVQTMPGEGAKNRIRAIEVWDVVKPQRLKTITKTEELIFSVRYSPDGNTLACVVWTEPNPVLALLDRIKRSKGSEVRRWNLKTGEKIAPLVGVVPKGTGVRCRSSYLCLAISPDGQRVATGSKITDEEIVAGAHIGGEVCVWDANTGKLLWSDHTMHTDIVYAVEFSPDGRTLATAGIDKLIRLWDPETGRLRRTLVGAAWNGISSLAFSADGKWLASGGQGGHEEGGVVRIWELETCRSKYTFTAGGRGRFRRGTAVRVGFSTDTKTMFAVGQVDDSEEPRWKVRAWEVATGHEKESPAEGSGYARAISIAPNGKQLAIGTAEGEVVIVSADPP